MYIDERLVSELIYVSGNLITRGSMESYLEENAQYYTLQEAKDDQECENLEEVMKCFFIVVDGDDVKFVGDEILDRWF